MTTANTDNDYIDEQGVRNVKCPHCGDWASSHYDANVPLVLCGDCGEPCCNACATDDAATICKVCVAKKATKTETKPCTVCGTMMERTTRLNSLWAQKTTCSTKCYLASIRSLYLLHAVNRHNGSLWLVRSSYNHGTTATHHFLKVTANQDAILEQGYGKGGRITKEWDAR